MKNPDESALIFANAFFHYISAERCIVILSKLGSCNKELIGLVASGEPFTCDGLRPVASEKTK